MPGIKGEEEQTSFSGKRRTEVCWLSQLRRLQFPGEHIFPSRRGSEKQRMDISGIQRKDGVEGVGLMADKIR